MSIYFFVVAAIILIGYAIFQTYTFTLKYLKESVNPVRVKDLIKLMYSSIAVTLGLLILVIGCNITYHYNMNALDIILSIISCIIFGASVNYLYFISGVSLYRKELMPKFKYNIKDWLYILVLALVVVLSMILLLECLSDYIKFPLPNAIYFSSNGVGLSRYNEYHTPQIPFYGMTMVGGAIISYLVSDYHFYKKFGKHGIIDSLFVVAFPAGLIGGRLWYCLILEPEYYLKYPNKILHIWEGGMGIMGGALLGIIAGVAFMLIFRKKISIFFAIDAIVPTILIAQSIGRWGNFFNHEVYGKVISYESLNFLPSFIQNHMMVDFSNPSSGAYVPLFLVEVISNLCGYYVITRLIPRVLKKFTKEGDLAGWYLVWYGLTRVILEPLRYGDFQYDRSYFFSFILVGGGLVVIAFCHLMDYLRNKKLAQTN